jgi:NADH-quinone oxidoreductase subunit L
MYHAIVFLPLVGFLIAGLFGRVLGARASELVTTGLLIVSAVLSWIAFIDVGYGSGATRVQVAQWMVSGDLVVDWAFRIDTLTAVMLVVVNSVSALVHLYSIGYMHEDPHRPRFFAYLSLFTFAMLMLVTADNLLQMFFGWEGVGLASYLLIGFWYQKESANAAAMKAFVVNRVGDFGFLLGIFLIFVLFGAVTFEGIFPRVGRCRTRRSCSWATSGTRSRSPACCSSWAPWASRRSSCCTRGFPTLWRARLRSPPSSMRPPWSRRASSWSRACRRSSSTLRPPSPSSP